MIPAVCVVALVVYFTYGIHHSKLNDTEYHQQQIKYVELDQLTDDDDDDDDDERTSL